MSLFNYECDEIKQIIDEVSLNYPQLTTYEKEWLFFNKYHYIPAIPDNLEWQEVIVNPTGTVQNAIPYQYKSVIFKGNTLINLSQSRSVILEKSNDIYAGGVGIIQNFKPNTSYLLSCHIDNKFDTPLKIRLSTNTQYINATLESGYVSYKFTTNNYEHTNLFIYNDTFTTFSGETVINDINIIEYQDDMENWIIPYFEGVHSVKMPVLTISNEDGTISNSLTASEEIELCGIGDVKDELNLLTGELTQRIGKVVLDGSEKWIYDSTHSIPEQLLRFATKIPDMIIRPYNTGKFVVSPCNFYVRNNDYANGNPKLPNVWDYYENSIYIEFAPSQLGVSVDDSNSTILEKLKTHLGTTPLTVQYRLLNESVKTVDLTKLTKPYEGTNNYSLTANIPCEAILEVPVVLIEEEEEEEETNN